MSWRKSLTDCLGVAVFAGALAFGGCDSPESHEFDYAEQNKRLDRINGHHSLKLPLRESPFNVKVSHKEVDGSPHTMFYLTLKEEYAVPISQHCNKLRLTSGSYQEFVQISAEDGGKSVSFSAEVPFYTNDLSGLLEGKDGRGNPEILYEGKLGE